MTTHLLSSPFLRPNGITIYIDQLIKADGGILISDGEAESPMPFPYMHHSYQYQGGERDGHFWMTPDPVLQELWNQIVQEIEGPILAHCVMSAQACHNAGKEFVFVQHESDVYYPVRWNYMSDELIAQHKQLLPYVTAGCIIPPSPHMDVNRYERVPLYYGNIPKLNAPKKRDVVVIADESERKGLDRVLGLDSSLKVSLISWAEVDLPENWIHRRFENTEVAEKIRFIAEHEYAIVPSRSEATCLAVLDCITQIPVVVFDEPWTQIYRNYVTIAQEGGDLTPKTRFVGPDLIDRVWQNYADNV